MSRRMRGFGTTFAVAVVLSTGLIAVAFQGGGPGQGPPPPGQGPARGAGPGGGGRAGGPQGRGPARDALNQQTATGTATISGSVTLQGSGTPVRRATVALSGTELRGVRTATTNDQGSFSFVALPAGRFNLNVTKPGFVSIAYGAKKPGRQGTPIQLSDGQKLEGANIALPRGSVITGVVIDEHGEPSPNTQVRAYRYVLRNGEKALQNAGQDQTDDRGMYRIFQLQPGEYMVSATPRERMINDVRQQIESQLQPLLQQLQASGAGGARAAAGRGGAAADAINNLLQGGRGERLVERIEQLQAQLQQQPDTPSVAYAPVYYPGTTTPAAASRVTLGIGEERGGVDFQLQLVATARIQGVVVSSDGTAPQNVQISLQPAGQDLQGLPDGPGNNVRSTQDGKFSVQNVTPGQYTLMARAAMRDPNAPQDAQTAVGRGGRGGALMLGARGRGGFGNAQLMWASANVTVDGRDIPDVTLTLQPGMSVSGRISFDASTEQPPADLSGARVTLQSTGQSNFEMGPMRAAQVDVSGQFSIAGVVPGQYSLRGNVTGRGGPGTGAPQGVGPQPAAGGALAQAAPAAGGRGWTLKSAVVNGRDTLDFPVDIQPNENISGASIVFTDRTQELTGTLQDAMGRPTADYTVIVFAADNRYWTPQSRRIVATRPGTDGKFSFRNLPAGQYRLTAVTDAEQGEWFDPAFLSQVVGASISLTLAEGEKKVQDIRLAGGY